MAPALNPPLRGKAALDDEDFAELARGVAARGLWLFANAIHLAQVVRRSLVDLEPVRRDQLLGLLAPLFRRKGETKEREREVKKWLEKDCLELSRKALSRFSMQFKTVLSPRF